MSSPVWDMTLSWSADFRDMGYLRSLADAGVNVVGLTLAADRHEDPAEVKALIHAFLGEIEAEPRLLIAHSLADIDRAVREGLLAIELNFQGTGPLGGDLDEINTFHELGVRHMCLVWNAPNRVGGSSAFGPDDGLTRFGQSVVVRMNEVGVLVDGAHTGERTILDAIEVAVKPVIVSHMNCAAVTPVPKNLSDDVIKACAQSGGVLGVSGFGYYAGDLQASVAAIGRHIDHIANLAGIDHVGLGLDYVTRPEVFRSMVLNWPQLWPTPDGSLLPESAFFDPCLIPELGNFLAQRGYAAQDVAKVLGGNWYRVCAECWSR